MGNYTIKELALGKTQVPSYTPYIVVDVTAAPWPVPSAEHTAAASKWKANRQAAKAVNPQAVPCDAWLLYRLRFIFTADLLGTWADYGGISAHLNFISISLHIATTESIAAALIYDGLISTHLEEIALSRANKADGAVGFSDLLTSEHSRFKIQAATQAKHAVATAVLTKKEQKGEKEKARKRAWLPKKEFLAKMEAEKVAKDKPPSRFRCEGALDPPIRIPGSASAPVVFFAAARRNVVVTPLNRRVQISGNGYVISSFPHRPAPCGWYLNYIYRFGEGRPFVSRNSY